jgi:hypothetical protein
MTKTMTPYRSRAAFGVLVAATLPARAQAGLIIVDPAHATVYLTGGIGKGEQNFLHRVA